MVVNNPCIVYKLPQTRMSQALKGRNKIETVWNHIEEFLENCTTAKIDNPDDTISLEAYSADRENGEVVEAAQSIIEKAILTFGDTEGLPIGYRYPSNEPLEQKRYSWNFQADKLPDLLQYMIKEQPYPSYNLGPLELSIKYSFYMIDPITREKLEGQDNFSDIIITLGRRCEALSPVIWFPYTQPNKDFWEYIERIKPFLPFRTFDTKWLYLVTSNKKHTDNKFSKLK